jgi:hypothetical protein
MLLSEPKLNVNQSTGEFFCIKWKLFNMESKKQEWN